MKLISDSVSFASLNLTYYVRNKCQTRQGISNKIRGNKQVSKDLQYLYLPPWSTGLIFSPKPRRAY